MRICIVDDHEVVREGLRVLLEKDPGLVVVGEARSGAETLEIVRTTRPDVVLVDFRLPDMAGSELCRQLVARHPGVRVVVVTTYLSEELVRDSMASGASAFVTKASGATELRQVLRDMAAQGDAYHQGSASSVVHRQHSMRPASDGDRRLTPRQADVLELAADGLTYSEIATRLGISQSTVRFHIQMLKDQVGARTKTELISKAIREALIAPSADATG